MVTCGFKKPRWQQPKRQGFKTVMIRPPSLPATLKTSGDKNTSLGGGVSSDVFLSSSEVKPLQLLKSASYLLLRVLHPAHPHLASAGHPHRVSVGPGGGVRLAGVRLPGLLGVRVGAHAVELRALHRRRVQRRHLEERHGWLMRLFSFSSLTAGLL